jgi:hypothetical protein
VSSVNDRKAGVVAGFATVPSAAAQFLPSVFVSRCAVGPQVTLLVALGPGCHLGQEVDVPAESRRLVGVRSLGSVAALFLIGVAVLALTFAALVGVGVYAAPAFRTFEEARERIRLARTKSGTCGTRTERFAGSTVRLRRTVMLPSTGGREQSDDTGRERVATERRERAAEETD